MPEAGERVRHGCLLLLRQTPVELAFDDLQMFREDCVVSPAPFGRQQDANAAPIAGNRLAPDQPGRLDPIHETGEAAPREQRASLQLLHPKPEGRVGAQEARVTGSAPAWLPAALEAGEGGEGGGGGPEGNRPPLAPLSFTGLGLLGALAFVVGTNPGVLERRRTDASV
jgi:hypothetical protein